ncbi:MAG: helix-turn-helix domain-containing protein [Firmicutes bacterium]|nr:helix-turn-helix domain-containing protein [Bacillota bacterium]
MDCTFIVPAFTAFATFAVFRYTLGEVINMGQRDVAKALAIVREHFEEIEAALAQLPNPTVRVATCEVLQQLIMHPSVGDKTLASPAILTPAQAARLLGASPDSVRRWCEQGRIPCYRTPGGRWRIARRDLVHVDTFRYALEAVSETWAHDPETQFDA